MNDTHKTQKYKVIIASRTLYALCVDSHNEEEAEEKAWNLWEENSSRAECLGRDNEIISVEEAAR